jgi:mono/diheme cytochrome c family protein
MDWVTWASIAVALVLVAVSVAVAAVRSGQREAVASAPGAGAEAGAGTAAAELLALGAEVWEAECAACHEAAEVAAAAAGLAATPAGGASLIDFMLDGRARRASEPPGPARHPAYPELTDREIAAVLDHLLTTAGHPPSYQPADVAPRRLAIRP